MTAKALKNPAASIRRRLFDFTKQSGDVFQRVLTRYAIERLLYRLSQTEAGDRYVLKGAMLFATWPQHMFRPSGDVDFLGQGDPSPDAIHALFTRICAIECLPDGIVFDPQSLKVVPVRDEERYRGVELSVDAILGTARIPVQVDVGFGDHVYPMPKRQDFPGLLEGLPKASLLMYPAQTVLAEKFEAMVRFGLVNSRVKDFYDMWIIIRTFPLDLADVVEAVGGTLRSRVTPIPTVIPMGLTEEFAKVVEANGLWSGFLRRTPPAEKPESFAVIQAELLQFFGPVIDALSLPEAARGRWDPTGGSWI